MTRVIAFVRAHWKTVAVAGAILVAFLWFRAHDAAIAKHAAQAEQDRQERAAYKTERAADTAKLDAIKRQLAPLESSLRGVSKERERVVAAGAELVKKAEEPGGADAVVDAYRKAGYQAMRVPAPKAAPVPR